ncbi:MAG: pseudouridine synthase [Alcaligenaceae bacterium]|nr:pseudouridine synthase [Alcaligenaceae bacterium]
MKAPLPVRDGISPSRLFLPVQPANQPWQTLMDFLLVRFSHLTVDQIEERLTMGLMVNEDGDRMSVDSPYMPETWLWYYRQVDQEIPVPFEMPILFEDEYLIVVDKPHFLASVPGGRYLQETALIRLRKLKQNYDISPIHRLDRDTAGVLIFTKSPEYRAAYQMLFEQQRIHKVYEAIAPFPPSFLTNSQVNYAIQECKSNVLYDDGIYTPYVHRSRIARSDHYFVMQETDGAPNSETQIEVLKCLSETRALYRLKPLTGKKHQLRVHMNSLGCPIDNDVFYPVLQPASAQDDFDKPLKLLARQVEFEDPLIGKLRIFKSSRVL